eukprot:jgi/Botrbrau1/15944/Bobra.0260s0005.1
MADTGQASAPVDAILLLGGDAEREFLTAELAAGNFRELPEISAGLSDPVVEVLVNPRIPIFISSGHGNVGQVFISAGVDAKRIHLDTRATDTVTNYTTLVPPLIAAGYRHVAVVTSDYHVQRADLIARHIFRALRMQYTMCSLPSTNKFGQDFGETKLRMWRDLIRTWLWLYCGLDVSFLGRIIHPERFRHRPVNAFEP